MIFYFFVSGLVTFLAVAILIVTKEQIVTKSDYKYIRIAINGIFKLFIRQGVVVFSVALVFLVLLAVIAILTIAKTYHIHSDLYEIEELLTSDAAAKAILGIVFGALLATWVARTYNLKPGTALPFLQKLEGGAILVLFIMGTTSISIEDLVRGFQVDGASFKFQLASPLASAGTASGGASGVEPPKKLEAEKYSSDPSADTFVDGFSLIVSTERTMNRDREYLDKFSDRSEYKKLLETHDKVTKEFERGLGPLIKCMDSILKRTGDRRQIFSAIAPLRLPLGAIYLNLQNKGDSKNSVTFEIRQASAKRALRESLSSLAKTMEKYANGIAAETECKSISGEDFYASSLGEGTVELRPYLGTIYSALLYMDGQQRRAITVLNEAIDAIIEGSKVGSINSLSREEPALWYAMRALFNLIYMTEDLIEKEGTKTSELTREVHLKRIQQTLRILKKIDRRLPYRSIYGFYKLDGIEDRTLTSTGFRRDPGFQQVCPEDSDFQAPMDRTRSTIFSYIYLNNQALFAYRSLDHSEFARKFSKISSDIVENLSNTDLSCAQEIGLFSRDELKIQRAEYLYIYARLQMKLAEIRRRIGPGYKQRMREILENARNSANLALEIIDDANIDKKTRKSQAASLAELKGKLARLTTYADSWFDRFR